MGLGKTFQIISFLTGLMRMKKIQRVLILSPVSVLSTWIKELNDHLRPYVKNSSIELIHSELAKSRRLKIIK